MTLSNPNPIPLTLKSLQYLDVPPFHILSLQHARFLCRVILDKNISSFADLDFGPIFLSQMAFASSPFFNAVAF